MKEKAKSRAFFVGRRKTASGVVRLHKKTESSPDYITVNRKPGATYFQGNATYLNYITQPLKALGVQHDYTIEAKVRGGGLHGQSESIRLGVARALANELPKARACLKLEGLLTRDSRRKERKKYGRKKARKSSQYSKR